MKYLLSQLTKMRLEVVILVLLSQFQIFFFPSAMLMCLLVCKVEGYYNIIEEPMDFGTMRAKLQEQIYTTLEQFEVCSFINSDSPFLSHTDILRGHE